MELHNSHIFDSNDEMSNNLSHYLKYDCKEKIKREDQENFDRAREMCKERGIVKDPCDPQCSKTTQKEVETVIEHIPQKLDYVISEDENKIVEFRTKKNVLETIYISNENFCRDMLLDEIG